MKTIFPFNFDVSAYFLHYVEKLKKYHQKL